MSVPPDQMVRPDDPALPEMEPATSLGFPVVPASSAGDRVKRPRGLISANADTLGYELGRSFSRWVLPGEIFDEAIDIEQHREIVGDADVPFTPGITAAESERRLNLFEFEKREALYDGHPISQFASGMFGALPEPVSVLTLPVGGANFKAAKAITQAGGGWLPFLKQTAIGGGKAGAASLAPEYLFQQAETGQIETERLVGSVIGPVVAGPALGALARGMAAGYRGLRTKFSMEDAANAHRAASADPTVHPLEGLSIIRQAEEAGLPPPFIGTRTAPDPVPMQRLRDTFKDYPGEWRGFIRDLGARRENALVRMRQLGLGPDDEVAARLIRALGDDTDARLLTPVDFNIKLTDLVNLFRQGEILDADQIRLLVDSGLVKMRGRMERTKPRVRMVTQKPRVRPGELQKPRFRVIGQEDARPRIQVTGTAPGRTTVRPDLEGGKPRVRVGQERPRVRVTGEQAGRIRLRPSPSKPRFRFVTEGGKPRLRMVDDGGEQVRFVGDEDGAELSVLGKRLVGALINSQGGNRQQGVNRRILQVMQARGVGALRDLLRDDPGLDDDLGRIIGTQSIDAPTVIHHLEAAQFRREVPDPDTLPNAPVTPPQRPTPDSKVVDAATASAEAQAKAAGLETSDISEAVGKLFDGMNTCGR